MFLTLRTGRKQFISNFVDDEKWHPGSTACVDKTVCTPNLQSAFLMQSKVPSSDALLRAGQLAVLPSDFSQPTMLRFYVRTAKSHLATALLLLCGDDDSQLSEEGSNTAIWFHITGGQRSLSGQPELGLISGGRFVGCPCTALKWYFVEIKVDWKARSTHLWVDGNLISDAHGMGLSFRDKRVLRTEALRLACQSGGHVWFGSIEVISMVKSDSKAADDGVINPTSQSTAILPKTSAQVPSESSPLELSPLTFAPLPIISLPEKHVRADYELVANLRQHAALLMDSNLSALACERHECSFPTVMIKVKRGLPGLLVYAHTMSKMDTGLPAEAAAAKKATLKVDGLTVEAQVRLSSPCCACWGLPSF